MSIRLKCVIIITKTKLNIKIIRDNNRKKILNKLQVNWINFIVYELQAHKISYYDIIIKKIVLVKLTYKFVK